MVANDQQQAVWRWDQQEPFGVNVPDENPSGLGSFEFPLRFPGQYADKETNLHYNYFRDYDPSIGRYGESDPVGLRGGINTYLYVEALPIFLFDRTGAMPEVNGNVEPGFSPQNDECDRIDISILGVIKINISAIGDAFGCLKQCCVEHDRCYARHGCNASSWKGWKGSPCQICNSDFKRCLYRGPSAACLPGCDTTFNAAP